MEVLLVADVADSTAAAKGRNRYPILPGNVMSANLENLQQLEMVILKTARVVYHYKPFASHAWSALVKK